MKQSAFPAGRRIGLLVLSLFILLLDQIVKLGIRQYPVHEVIADFAPLFDLIRSENAGASFSLFQGYTTLLILLTAALLLIIGGVMLLYSGISPRLRWTLSVMLGGGLGNLADRILFGTVTDYIRLRFISFPVFNLADICITCSVFAALVLVMTGDADNGVKHESDC